MKRALFLIAIILLAPVGLRPAQAQTSGQFCIDYSTNFATQWQILVGNTVGTASIYSQVNNANFDNTIRVSQISPFDGSIREVWIVLDNRSYAGTPDTNPYNVLIRLYQANGVLWEQTFSYSASTSNPVILPHIPLPDTAADRIFIQVTQASNNTGAPSDVSFMFRVDRLCGTSAFPTPTNTATNTRTPRPTDTGTPYPTITQRPTSTRTPTRTNVPTQTAQPTWTPASSHTPHPTNTLAPTSTPGGSTDTPIPTSTNEPSDTAVPPQPSQEPQQSTLGAYAMNTPEPPPMDCTDFTDPCNLWPDLNLPDPNLDPPTAIAQLPTLTPLASITLAPIVLGTGTLVYINQVYQISTAVAGLQSISMEPTITDGAGNNVSVAQRVYDSGAQIGGFFGVVRGFINTDIGPAGNLLLVLLAMLVLNIQVRILLFIVPIILRFIQFLIDVFGSIIKLIPFIMLAAALIIIPHRANAATPTPIPTWTPTPTLRAPAATSTSKFQGFRPTPSPFQITPNAAMHDAFDTTSKGGELADMTINSYRFFNSKGVLDMVGFIAMLGIITVVAVNLYRTLTKDVK